MPITIDMLIRIVDKAQTIMEFDALIEEIVDKLRNESVEDYKKYLAEYV